MSTIVWVLTISIGSAFCAGSPQIQFKTEQECETARAGLIISYGLKERATCEPRKAAK